MQDANELAHAIIDVVNGVNTLSGAVKQYEEKMFKRAKVSGKESAENLNLKIHQRALSTSSRLQALFSSKPALNIKFTLL